MAGLSKRFCDRCEGDSESFRGTCGGCLGTYDNCDDEEPPKCGNWVDPSCTDVGGTTCGDGHECPLYVDITFTLHSFLIQGEVCCNSLPKLTEPCGGTVHTGKDPSTLTPWTAISPDGGLHGEVTYNTTTHHVRLTRGYGDRASGSGGEACFCFYGGYWSGSCDCNKCCCSEDYPYSTCPEEDVIPSGVSCAGGHDTEPCDPDNNPCYLVTTGWASSLDVYGSDTPTEQGGSTGQAMCTVPSSSGVDTCDYIDESLCSGKVGYACWESGTFNPHHIEAYMAFTSSDCVGSWQLEIKGLTEQARSQMGASNLGLDCLLSSGHACSEPAFGGHAEPAWGYIGRWWGKNTTDPVCNQRCDEASQSGDGYPELRTMGCACPPHTSFSSTVTTTNTLPAFHPDTRYWDSDPVSNPSAGGLMTCTIPHADCGNADWLLLFPQTPYDGTNYYGKPIAWWDDCTYCDLYCDGDWSGCTGCTGTNCGSVSCPNCCGAGEDAFCTCTFPSEDGQDDLSNPSVSVKQYPCSHCTDDGQTNPAECFTNPACSIERICANCDITINPNSNPLPAWAEA